MQSLFSYGALQKIQKIRKIFLKSAVWTLIAELSFGAIIILAGGYGSEAGKLSGTFLILTLVLFVSVNNFIRIEKGDKSTQIFALIGPISNLVWGIFATL